MAVTRNFSVALISLLAVACGGGGGGGSTTSPPPPPGPSFLNISTAAVNAINVEGGTAKAQQFSAVLTPEGQARFSTGDTIFIIVTSSSPAVTAVNVSITGVMGTATVSFNSSLSVGRYTGSIRIQLCKDAACADQVSTDTISVQYDVLTPPIPSNAPLELAFTRYQDQDPATVVLPLDFTPYGATVGDPVFRLELDPEISSTPTFQRWVEFLYENDQLTLTAPDVALPCGTYDGELVLQYETVNFDATQSVPVQLTVSSLPVIESVHPKLGFTDRATEHLIVGCGFSAISASDVSISGLSPTALTITSDTEMSLSLPAGSAAGTYTLDVSSQMVNGAPTDQLIVKQPVARPDLQYDTMATSVTNNGSHLWDEARETLYVRRFPQDVMRFVNTGSQWVVTQDVFGDDEVDKMYLSASGNLIITRTGFNVAVYSAETLAKLSEFSVGFVGDSDLFSTTDKLDNIYFARTFSSGSDIARVFSASGTFVGQVRYTDTTGYRGDFHTSGNKDIVFTSHRRGLGGWYRYDVSDDSIVHQPGPIDSSTRIAYPSFTGKVCRIQ